MTQEDISELQEKLRKAKRDGVGKKKELPKKIHGSEVDAESMNIGMRAGSELIVGMAAGGLIGYGLDHWLDTKPIFFLIFLILGVGVGFLNIYKLSQNIGTSVGFAELHQKKSQKPEEEK
ncbi:MAG: AtpZ/AtpI family protein [Bdellovibrionales bacterium]